MSESPRMKTLLDSLERTGRSSPEAWDRFYKFLQSKKKPGQPDPPVPLILAASAESNASKHRRLSEQLAWALENGCLDDALGYLEQIPAEQWNSCPEDRWHQESYPVTEDHE
jgi:hypothetical protein